jgi:hypothetical protein
MHLINQNAIPHIWILKIKNYLQHGDNHNPRYCIHIHIEIVAYRQSLNSSQKKPYIFYLLFQINVITFQQIVLGVTHHGIANPQLP